MTPPVAPTDEQIRALATEILKRPEYALWRPDTWLRPILDWLGQLAATSPSLYWALIALLLLLSFGLLAHVAWAVRVALAMPAPGPPGHPGTEDPRFADEAEVLAAAGRFLEAAHRLELAVIHLLLHRRIVELVRSDPNRTLRQRIRAATLPEADRDELVALLDAFERRWFRDRGEDRTLYDAWRALYGRLDTVLGPT